MVGRTRGRAGDAQGLLPAVRGTLILPEPVRSGAVEPHPTLGRSGKQWVWVCARGAKATVYLCTDVPM